MAEERNGDGEALPSAPPSLADALATTSLKPSWMSGGGGALAKPAPTKVDDGGLSQREEVTSFGICDKRYGYKSRKGYGHRSFEKRNGKRSNRDRDRRDHGKDLTRDQHKEKWERGLSSSGDKERTGREHSGRRDRDRGKDRERGSDGKKASTKSKGSQRPRYADTGHSMSPRLVDGSERQAMVRRGSLPSSEVASSSNGVSDSQRGSDSNSELERARALVPSQPLAPKKKGGKSRQRDKRGDSSKSKRTADHYYPNRPPPINFDPASLQPLTQLTSPRYHGSAVSPRSHSPSPSPRGTAITEESKVPLSAGSRRARTSFFDSLRERDGQTGPGSRFQLSMRSADDLLMAGNPNKGSRKVFRASPPNSKPRGAMAKGKVGSPFGSPSVTSLARGGPHDGTGTLRRVQSSDSDRVLISEEDEEEEQRLLKEMGWSKDEEEDGDDWQLTEEEIARTRQEMVDKNLSLEANLPLSRMQYFQNFQKTMPASVATASSPALLRFATRTAATATAPADRSSP